jgi:hypothetical protein
MALIVGSKVGGYEVVARIGAGGMGEVYRARDRKLGRDVALKVLPAEVAVDHERLLRFELEARAASALNHPNIVTIYEVGCFDSTSYIAMEYVDGTTLRELISGGPLPTRKLLEVGAQAADGLAKAHAAGIVHRDLKPENLMVTKDGFVKILDFGLAKLSPTTADGVSDLPTISRRTEPGTVLGTVGYMSPEQAGGKVVDFRSDQFALGAILYELATGRRAFRRPTAAQTLAAIIQDDPEPIATLNLKTPAPLRWTIERCLAKEPEQRYASTRDLERDLATIRDRLSEASSTVGLAARADVRGRWRPVALVVGFALSIAVAVAVTRRVTDKPPPLFNQLTFRRGYVASARFMPDGRSIVYSAAWDGAPSKVYLKQAESPESAALELPNAKVLGISASGELALALDCKPTHFGVCSGTLARAPLLGGAPRAIQEAVQEGEWAPDGALAIVRDVDGGGARLELPPGRVLYETKHGHISHARFSPRGDRIAFVDHPDEGNDEGAVAVVDRAGTMRLLTRRFVSVRGLAWAGDEIWFTASEAGNARTLLAVTTAGRLRVIHRSAVSLTLFDVSRDGRALLAREDETASVLGAAAGETVEKDLAWLDASTAQDISADGKLLLLSEESGGFGGRQVWGVRKMDGSGVVRLGELGTLVSISPDGKRLLADRRAPEVQISIIPLGPGETRALDVPGVEIASAFWWPDGRIGIRGREPGHSSRVFLLNPETGARQAVTPEGVLTENSWALPAPDGRHLLANGSDGSFALYPLAGGVPIPTRFRLATREGIVRQAADGRSIFVEGWQQLPLPVYRVDVETGVRTHWRDFAPAERAGVAYVRDVVLSADGSAYAYKYRRRLSDLFLVESLR